MIACRFCHKCGTKIIINYYPFNRSIQEELDILESEHTLNLCDRCANSFAECNPKKIIFGSCVGKDNVIECDAFKRKSATIKPPRFEKRGILANSLSK
jgi:hypothetical protein